MEKENTLKTLKEIESIMQDLENGSLVRVKDLRAEAVKWVKEFQKERTDAISEMFDNVDKIGIYPTTEFFNRLDNFWKNKFNLKEEDLKDA